MKKNSLLTTTAATALLALATATPGMAQLVQVRGGRGGVLEVAYTP